MPLAIKPVHPVLPKPETAENGLGEKHSLNEIEDKELRKKLRNRQSALAARERKKARMLELERQVMELQESHKRLEHENHFLYSRLDFMKQKCTEAGVRFGDEQELTYPHLLNTFQVQRLNSPCNESFENTCTSVFNQSRDLIRPPHPANHHLHNFSRDCSANNFFPNFTNNRFSNGNNIFRKNIRLQHETTQRRADFFERKNLMKSNSETSFYNCTEATANSNQIQIKEEFDTTLQVLDFRRDEGNILPTTSHGLYSPNYTATTPQIDQPNQYCSEKMPISNSLPSIGEVLETNCVNRSTLINKSLSQTNFDKTIETAFSGAYHEGVKRRCDSASNTFKKSKSFHSLSVISPSTDSMQCEWPKPIVQNQLSDFTAQKKLRRAVEPNFELVTAIKKQIPNNFSAASQPHPNQGIKISESNTTGVKKARPNDHSSSDSGVSMDEHLDTWFDF